MGRRGLLRGGEGEGCRQGRKKEGRGEHFCWKEGFNEIFRYQRKLMIVGVLSMKFVSREKK